MDELQKFNEEDYHAQQVKASRSELNNYVISPGCLVPGPTGRLVASFVIAASSFLIGRFSSQMAVDDQAEPDFEILELGPTDVNNLLKLGTIFNPIDVDKENSSAKAFEILCLVDQQVDVDGNLDIKYARFNLFAGATLADIQKQFVAQNLEVEFYNKGGGNVGYIADDEEVSLPVVVAGLRIYTAPGFSGCEEDLGLIVDPVSGIITSVNFPTLSFELSHNALKNISGGDYSDIDSYRWELVIG